MKRSLAASVVLGFVAVLSACATPAGSGTPVPTSSSGASVAPDGAVEPSDVELDAAWLDGGRMIGVVTQGSSSCVPSAGDVTFADGVLAVEFVDGTDDQVCTADMAPRVTPVTVPGGVDPSADLEIHLSGDGYTGDTDLDGVPGLVAGSETDFTPTAGWLDADGQFVVLTWGSSSCPPVLQDVAATGASEVTVTFQTPDAEGQVCTMDMAPRALVVPVSGLEDEGNTTLVLTGGGVEATTKILGEG